MSLLINEAMRVEREQYLHALPYERTINRVSYANGYKPKKVRTRVGELSLSVPQTRDGFYPASLEKGLRSERALKLALAEMYIQGVSTRKVAEVTENLCGFSVTSDQVSRSTKALDGQLTQWRDRPLRAYPYLYVDARYEKIRENNVVVDAAVLIAKGVRDDGTREILGISVSLSEAEVHWRDFFQSLVRRGLHGIEMIISDSHSGLKSARRAVFPSIPWQRCQFHLQQNAQSYVKNRGERIVVGEKIRSIFNAPSRAEADRLLKITVEEYQKNNARLAEWMEDNIPESLTVFSIGRKGIHKKLRTTNPLERVNKEIKRRTRVVGIFPNADACLRLVTALLMETSEDWSTGNRFFPRE
jgi:transposase-like protein